MEERQNAERQKLSPIYHDCGLPDSAVDLAAEADESLSYKSESVEDGATFQKLRSRYKGTQSEGNRYIRNQEL